MTSRCGSYGPFRPAIRPSPRSVFAARRRGAVRIGPAGAGGSRNRVDQSFLRQESDPDKSSESSGTGSASQLSHWPVQLKLVSTQAAYFDNADLLFVADCVPFAMGDFHERFLKGRSVVVGCPKLDDSAFYIDKMAQILKNNIKSLTVIHMEVPCCSGLTHIVRKAIEKNKIAMSFEDVTIDIQGNVSKTEIVQN